MKTLMKRSGMAIAVVLIFASVLLMLGGAYIKTISNVRKINPKMLEQVQADFFGQGISKIALLKFKKYPSDFYHAFILSKRAIPNSNPTSPSSGPFDSFKGADGSILQMSRNINIYPLLAPASFPVQSFVTDFTMVTHKAYNKDGLEITVRVELNGMWRSYQTTIEASRTRIL